jgi:hypothetical protein
MKIELTIIFLIIWNFFTYSINANIVINEVQPAPINSEPEWVELYNFQDYDFTCKECLINDATNSKVTIPDFTLKSKKFAILTKDSTELKNRRKIPDECLIIQMNKLPTFNNTNDLIVIRQSDLSVIDSVYYDMKWGKSGKSLERIDWMAPAVSKDNWAASCSPDSATTGYENCNAIRELAVQISLSRDINKNLIFNFLNSGRKNLSFFNFEISADLNRNNFFAEDEIILYGSHIASTNEKSFQMYVQYDSIAAKFSKKGYYKCLLTVLIENKNDTLAKFYFDLYNSYPFNSIAFNEIMFDVSNNNSEYLEFYNSTFDTIDFNNWFIANKQNRTKSDTFKIKESVIIEPKSYFLFALDTTIYNKFPELRGAKNVLVKHTSFNLLADGDKLIIADPNGLIMDSVNYDPSMHISSLSHSKDISLEKINVNFKSYEKTSWTSSMNESGGTPAKANSISEIINPEGFITAKPNPFSPFSQGIDSYTEIQYELPFKDALINAKIFDAAGFLVYEPVNNRISASVGSIQWNGKNKNDQLLPLGQYIVLLQASDIETNKIWESKIVVVIGK